jgi:hypothetical protein
MENLSWAEKVEATRLSPIGSYMLTNDTKIIQRHGWYQLITPWAKTSSLNEVIFTEIPHADV